MAKSQLNNRLAKNNRGEHVVEQQVSIDDSLLPAALELEKLKEIDPTIVPWIMARAEQEQSARLERNRLQGKIMEYDVKGHYRFNLTALLLGFVLFLSILAAAVFLILRGLNVQGTVLGGFTIVVAVVMFMRAAIQKKESK